MRLEQGTLMSKKKNIGFATPSGARFKLARDSGDGRGCIPVVETQHKVDETGGDDAENDVGGGPCRWSHSEDEFISKALMTPLISRYGEDRDVDTTSFWEDSRFLGGVPPTQTPPTQ